VFCLIIINNNIGPQKKSIRFREANQHILMYFEPLNPNPS